MCGCERPIRNSRTSRNCAGGRRNQMGCTTLLVGRKATNDGSTIVARNEDTGDGTFTAKKMIVVEPQDQPRTYTGVENHLTMELPDNPLRYVCVPNADPSMGVWGEAGINAANVSMSATETITSNSRVLGADPLVCYEPAKGTPGEPGYVPEKPGGIGEENYVTIILPYIQSARQGVEYMGKLLEEYGTYEMNGVAFGDSDEVWYVETIGGHHWIARRVPDDCYVAQPNRQGIDCMDLLDALGPRRNFMCSPDLPQWMADNNLNVAMVDPDTDTMCGIPVVFNPREAFSSFRYLDMRYNNARAWYICRMLNRNNTEFQGPDAEYGPESFDIPWCMRPEVKLSVQDVKNVLSSTYDGTKYDCYGVRGTEETRHEFRDIGINRTSELSILNIRNDGPPACRGVQWYACGSNPFNTCIAVYTNVHHIPDYLSGTTEQVGTDSFYWTNRLIGALADPEFFQNLVPLYEFQQDTLAQGYASVHATDLAVQTAWDSQGANGNDMNDEQIIGILEAANAKLIDAIRKSSDKLLSQVLFERSLHMKNAFGASDA